jgi:hypothetical protein
MGIDTHALLFLRRVCDTHGPLGKTATIGRQAVHVPSQVAEKLIGVPIELDPGTFCETMLVRHFGSTVVHSFDNSDYEGATHVFDLNDPLPTDFYDMYDTIIDSGSLEHIYDTRTVLNNITSMLKPGGQVIHMNPSNNFCGHGFYQFSPEFYFSAYSSSRGFTNAEVFLAKVSNSRYWFYVKEPKGGQRAEVSSGLPLVCLVRAQKLTSGPLNTPVQQSDYVHHWGGDVSSRSSVKAPKVSRIKALLAKNRLIYAIAMRSYFSLIESAPYQTYLYRWQSGLSTRNKCLTKVPARQRHKLDSGDLNK